MKIFRNLLLIAVSAIAFTACSQEDEVPATAVDDRPLIVTASMPVSAWGVESRAEGGITDLTLYYYAADGGENAAPQDFQVTNTATDGTISFTTGVDNDKRLVWSQIKKVNNNATFYLTVEKDDLEYWASATVTHGESVTFRTMMPRMSKFTINLNVATILSSLAANDFVFTLSDVQAAAANATDVTVQAWPVEQNATEESHSFNVSVTGTTVSATALFAPQTVGNLTITYKDTKVGEINLAEVSVSKDNAERTEKANVLNAGEHITVTANLNLMELTPSINAVEGFTADSGTHNFNGTVTPNP